MRLRIIDAAKIKASPINTSATAGRNQIEVTNQASPSNASSTAASAAATATAKSSASVSRAARKSRSPNLYLPAQSSFMPPLYRSARGMSCPAT